MEGLFHVKSSNCQISIEDILYYFFLNMITSLDKNDYTLRIWTRLLQEQGRF